MRFTSVQLRILQNIVQLFLLKTQVKLLIFGASNCFTAKKGDDSLEFAGRKGPHIKPGNYEIEIEDLERSVRCEYKATLYRMLDRRDMNPNVKIGESGVGSFKTNSGGKGPGLLLQPQ